MRHRLQALALFVAVGIVGGTATQTGSTARWASPEAVAYPESVPPAPPRPIDPEGPACCQSSACKC